MPNYLFSIIVPSYNRSDEIIDLLNSFGKQSKTIKLIAS